MERVLIVDDDESFLSFVSLVLNKDFKLITAKNYNEAIEILDKEEFDALILDVSLPGYTGYYLAEQIRKEDTQIPIAFLTNYDAEVTRENAVAVDALLWQKASIATNPNTLIEKVRSLIYG